MVTVTEANLHAPTLLLLWKKLVVFNNSSNSTLLLLSCLVYRSPINTILQIYPTAWSLPKSRLPASSKNRRHSIRLTQSD